MGHVHPVLVFGATVASLFPVVMTLWARVSVEQVVVSRVVGSGVGQPVPVVRSVVVVPEVRMKSSRTWGIVLVIVVAWVEVVGVPLASNVDRVLVREPPGIFEVVEVPVRMVLVHVPDSWTPAHRHFLNTIILTLFLP